jgi:hypothetical protein
VKWNRDVHLLGEIIEEQVLHTLCISPKVRKTDLNQRCRSLDGDALLSSRSSTLCTYFREYQLYDQKMDALTRSAQFAECPHSLQIGKTIRLYTTRDEAEAKRS